VVWGEIERERERERERRERERQRERERNVRHEYRPVDHQNLGFEV